ncbi:hypothetical protein SISSUDRAFT_1035351 [Sistotremastrum suecicum HHB10207 ss-3]|uniref:Uncharacterized protein n=1 Tax=Sistotremastrum suecicum HHB10207 ss-3 TaxID=1314776 RepID=A0A166AWI9_9AGAM|nr:hypothetical protein SISSUDRAFT_1035351 [Sistotremastrum suecicum HHB10207 ss-3]
MSNKGFESFIASLEFQNPASAEFLKSQYQKRVEAIEAGKASPPAILYNASGGTITWSIFAENNKYVYHGAGTANFDAFGAGLDQIENFGPLVLGVTRTFVIDAPANTTDKVATLFLKSGGYIQYETHIKGIKFGGDALGKWSDEWI